MVHIIINSNLDVRKRWYGSQILVRYRDIDGRFLFIFSVSQGSIYHLKTTIPPNKGILSEKSRHFFQFFIRSFRQIFKEFDYPIERLFIELGANLGARLGKNLGACSRISELWGRLKILLKYLVLNPITYMGRVHPPPLTKFLIFEKS